MKLRLRLLGQGSATQAIADVPNPDAPTVLPSGTVPSWVVTDEAPSLAAALWDELSVQGKGVLRPMMNRTAKETTRFLPKDLAEATNHRKGAAGVAGILGGVGKAIHRAGLPVYTTPKGACWHYIWDWDGERYSMTPQVAKLLAQGCASWSSVGLT